jgi:hypothetical protein
MLTGADELGVVRSPIWPLRSPWHEAAALVLFVLLATASFLSLELYATFAPAAADVRLQQLRTWLDTHRDQLIILLSLLLGLWLAGNSLYYLV